MWQIQIIEMSIHPLQHRISIFWRYPWIILELSEALFKEFDPFAWYRKNGLVILYISCSTTFQNFFTGLELSVQVSFRGRTRNFLKGQYRNKIKVDCRSELYFEQSVQICFLKVFVFEVLEVEDFGFLVPKIPNYVTYDLNYCVTRSFFFKMSISSSTTYNRITVYEQSVLTGKMTNKMCLCNTNAPDSGQFQRLPNLQGQTHWWYQYKVLVSSNAYVQYGNPYLYYCVINDVYYF